MGEKEREGERLCVLPQASVFQSIPSAERFITQTKLGGFV